MIQEENSLQAEAESFENSFDLNNNIPQPLNDQDNSPNLSKGIRMSNEVEQEMKELIEIRNNQVPFFYDYPEYSYNASNGDENSKGMDFSFRSAKFMNEDSLN